MAARSKFFNPKSIRTSARQGAQGDFWHKLVPVAYALLLAATIAVGAAMFYPLIERHQSHAARKLAIEQQIAMEQSRHLHLQEELYALKDDRFYIERMARDRLNFAREGETIFRFQPYSSPETGSGR